jgi:hypothetical protein
MLKVDVSYFDDPKECTRIHAIERCNFLKYLDDMEAPGRAAKHNC